MAFWSILAPSSSAPGDDGRRLAVEPERAIVFEDAPPGIASALAAGCAVIGVATTYSARDLTGAVFVVPDLSAVTVTRDEDHWLVLA
jgi:beta-phosphoglucomutase-like phosphatase (HAD superfamily)